MTGLTQRITAQCRLDLPKVYKIRGSSLLFVRVSLRGSHHQARVIYDWPPHTFHLQTSVAICVCSCSTPDATPGASVFVPRHCDGHTMEGEFDVLRAVGRGSAKTDGFMPFAAHRG